MTDRISPSKRTCAAHAMSSKGNATTCSHMHRVVYFAKACKQPCLIPQDFPYNLEAGVKHHNVWCTRPLSEVELAQVGTM